MKTTIIKSRLLLLLLLSLSCEEQTDWIFTPLENGALVVDAIITDEFKTQEVRLALSYDELNGSPRPVTDAQVKLMNGANTLHFQAEAGKPGRYFSAQPFSAQLHVQYVLEIDWQENTYAAKNEMTEVLPFNKITFQQAGADSLSIDEVAPSYSAEEQAMYEIDIDWPEPGNADPAGVKLFYYTFNTIDVSELLRPPQETVIFPKGSLVIEKKYSLNPEFAAYLRALLLQTEWQGGVFDEAASSLPTNVSNGGLGFFGVCAVLTDTLVAE